MQQHSKGLDPTTMTETLAMLPYSLAEYVLTYFLFKATFTYARTYFQATAKDKRQRNSFTTAAAICGTTDKIREYGLNSFINEGVYASYCPHIKREKGMKQRYFCFKQTLQAYCVNIAAAVTLGLTLKLQTKRLKKHIKP
uniref:Uncharacterized protein n=1 Tax=Glossina brevipalpis TaxID=37001 RepID=A0A1A9X1P3_9MUSC